MREWKIFEIIDKKHYIDHPDTVYFDLNEYFYFANNQYNTIWCANQEPFNNWEVGDTIKLDLNWLKKQTVGKDSCLINSTKVAKLVNKSVNPRTKLVSQSNSLSSQVPVYNLNNLPPVSAVVSGNYHWEEELNTPSVRQVEFQSLIIHQNQN